MRPGIGPPGADQTRKDAGQSALPPPGHRAMEDPAEFSRPKCRNALSKCLWPFPRGIREQSSSAWLRELAMGTLSLGPRTLASEPFPACGTSETA